MVIRQKTSIVYQLIFRRGIFAGCHIIVRPYVIYRRAYNILLQFRLFAVYLTGGNFRPNRTNSDFWLTNRKEKKRNLLYLKYEHYYCVVYAKLEKLNNCLFLSKIISLQKTN